MQRNVTFVEKSLHKNLLKIKTTKRKFRYHYHFTTKYSGTSHSICNIRFNVLNEILLVLTTDQTMIISLSWKNEQMSKGKFKCPGENTEKYTTFSVPIGKEIQKIDKDGNEDIVTYW